MASESSGKKVEVDPNQLLSQFQTYQMQRDSITKSLEIAKLQTLEIDKALEELGKTQQKTAYKISGQIMVSKSVEDLKKDLAEMKESIELQKKNIEKSKERIDSRMVDIQNKLKEMMK